MKRLLAIAVFVLGTSSAVCAQVEIPAVPQAKDNAAMDFAQTSAASRAFASDNGVASIYSASPAVALSNPSLSTSLVTFAPEPSAEPASPAMPALPNPKINYTERDYRWEIGLGVALVRFRSSVYYATAIGLNSSLSYFINDWLAIEGAVTSAFAPTIFQNEHVKFVGYGAGPKVSLGRRRLEPWAHALVGGIHILPQTALSGQNGFELLAGGGADYNLNPRLAVRLEADYLRTSVFGQSQNSGQATLGIIFHF